MIDYWSQVSVESEGQMAAILQQRYRSGQWWIFVPVDGRGIAELTKIEERFYKPGTPTSDDFEMAGRLSQRGLFAVALGHKRHLPARKLKRFLRRRGGQVDAMNSEHDVFILGDSETNRDAAIQLLHRLLRAS